MKYIDEELPSQIIARDKYVGEINIPDGEIDITDPCYDSDTWCAMFSHKIKPGKYKCYITQVNFPNKYEVEKGDTMFKLHKPGDIVIADDIRIMSLKIVHETESINVIDKCEIINDDIGVDAGLCGFYNHKPNYNDDEWAKFCDELGDDYPTCICKEDGITVSSGFGDGVYTLKEAKNKNKENVALELLFY